MTTKLAHFELPELWMELKDRTLLAELMEEQRKSARYISRIAGHRSHTYLQRVLKGAVKPNFDTVAAARIAHDLGVPFNLLFKTRVSAERAQDERKSA